jgi:hypothetical protein
VPLTDIAPKRPQHVLKQRDLSVAIEEAYAAINALNAAVEALGTGGTQYMEIVCGDEFTVLSQTQVAARRCVGARTLSSVRGSLTAGQNDGEGTKVTIDVKKNGVSIFSTYLTFNNGATTTVGAAVPAVIATTAFADDDEITVHVIASADGEANVAAGLKVVLIWA